ncbi:ABC transporter ATP-binding protein/permease [Limibaculum sp. FT325]|uniref:ABC transporter ATP-binding protein n=1 Tax=Thermohalobaculum sediminis TaxID=2939436 RepID=UPI0020BD8656|nr:ABC transporter ATP-binding protein [Limibaculum sediminis]MCL5777637.1 ABC transporter ATP-binding protein/permease [Limibaculum sediminis]
MQRMLAALLDRVLGPGSTRLIARLIAETAWAHRRGYALALGLMAVTGAMGAAIALLMEDVMQDVFVERRAETVPAIAAVVLAVFLIRGASTFGSQVILTRIGNRIVATLQNRVFSHVMAQGMAFHAGETTGDLTTRISMNAAQARAALQLIAQRLGADLFALLALVGVMLWQDLALSALSLIGLPAVLGGVGWLVGRVRKLARAEVTLHGRVLSLMAESVAGARVIRAFGLEDIMRGRMDRAVADVRDRSDRIAVFQGLVVPLMETMAGIAGAAVILYGGLRVIGGTMEAGTFFSFVTALFMAADPARRLAQLNVALRQQLAGVEAIYALLDTRAEIPELPGAPALVVPRGEIAFRDVRFAYGGVPALDGIDFTARAGKVTALVGPSGAGKSTVLALAERFFDPDSGRIEIDGQEIRTVSLASLRASMALVTQETFLFDATVAENIAYGRPGATRAEIEAAAAEANAAGFIADLPQGYDTAVGEGGGRLSGGQRQRIAIARAILRDAPILLLDEATSALDAESEAHVSEALARLMKGRTTIVIAHRLATVRRAHHIVVIDTGRVVEEGTHDILTGRGGLYARLAELQFGPQKERA